MNIQRKHGLLCNAFRELRKAWFDETLRHRSHDREWETEQQELRREYHNACLWASYDAETEAIIRGEKCSITPRCEAQLKNKEAGAE